MNVKVNQPPKQRDLIQGVLHFWSKFGDPSLKGWWVITRTSSWLNLSHTDTHTSAGKDNTRRPKLTSGKKSREPPSAHKQGPISEMIRLRSCDPDRLIAFHKRWSRSAHQTEKIRNQTVYCQLNHDINHSLGVLELKLRGRDWMKNARLMVSIHDITMGGVVTSFMSADTRALCPVQYTHTIQHGLDMPYLAGKCMWLTSLKLSKLLTQDRPCSI